LRVLCAPNAIGSIATCEELQRTRDVLDHVIVAATLPKKIRGMGRSVRQTDEMRA